MLSAVNLDSKRYPLLSTLFSASSTKVFLANSIESDEGVFDMPRILEQDLETVPTFLSFSYLLASRRTTDIFLFLSTKF